MSAPLHYEYAVIGAGPAGIATIGQLLDHQVDAKKILWIDPEFKVGDFGTKWRNIPSNTKVGLFLKFLNECASFRFNERPTPFELESQDPDGTTKLCYPADALQWITDHFIQTVKCCQGTAKQLIPQKGYWKIQLDHETHVANKVVLAIGSIPKTLDYTDPQVIPLAEAMDSKHIKQHLAPKDIIAVFGSSHSAILAIRELIEHKIKRVINFYRSPLKFALYLDDWILYDDTGLKGTTATWAREHVENPTKNLERYLATAENIAHYLPLCNKAIYAVGFQRRHLPIIDNLGVIAYDDKVGIIAPGLFGVGIAFPEGKITPVHALEYRVGLWKFMDYLNRVVPIWLRYGA